jgi:hypothetical protein
VWDWGQPRGEVQEIAGVGYVLGAPDREGALSVAHRDRHASARLVAGQATLGPEAKGTWRKAAAFRSV